ncbi:MAG: c-type cytochrome [Variibacter sp.]|nr:c-type cytochrome [Variibacter sp.]
MKARLLLLLALAASGGVAAAAQERGAALFAPCRACHALDPAADPMAGPNLAGLAGRRIAGDPQFDYSPVLRQAGASGERWTAERLDAFLADPEAMFPGMWMTARGVREPDDRRALVRFLVDQPAR